MYVSILSCVSQLFLLFTQVYASRNYYKIIWIVHVFWLVYKCVFVGLWSTKMMWAIWLPQSPSWENLQFHERNLNKSLWEFLSRWKPSTASQVFTDLLLNSPKRLPWFSPGYEGTENIFYFLIDNLQIRLNDCCNSITSAQCSGKQMTGETQMLWHHHIVVCYLNSVFVRCVKIALNCDTKILMSW